MCACCMALHGVTEWGDASRCHQWHTTTGEVAHRDLWDPCGNPFLDLVRERGDLFSIQLVPSHIKIGGKEKARQLAEKGRVRHWAYSREWLREVQQRQSLEWHALGPHELDPEGRDGDTSVSSEGYGLDETAVAGAVPTACAAVSHRHV